MLRRTYDWVLRMAARPTALRVLTGLSFLESMIFPIPPDVMLIPMCVASPQKAMRFAFWCSIGSVLGGMAGYALGAFAWHIVGPWFFAHVPGFSEAKFATVQGWYEAWNFWIVFTAGFTPLPYKIITITAGVFSVSFPMFVIASAVSRSARFFLVAWTLQRYGKPAQEFIDRYFNWVATAFVVLLLGGFFVVSRL